MHGLIMDQTTNSQRSYPPVTDELLAEIVKRVLAAGQPIKIVLFGSRARGNYKPDSDIDVLIIEESDQLLRKQDQKYDKALRDVFPELTVIACSLHNLEEWRYVPGHLITVALSEGKVLYENSDRLQTLLSTTSGARIVVEENVEYKTPSDLARDWFNLANQDILVSQDALEKEHCYSVICFHAHQAAEKYLKGFLALHNMVAEKTHDLQSLMRQCQDLKCMPELAKIELEDLTKFAIEGRYSPSFSPDPAIAEEALSRAQYIKEIILSYVPSTARPLA